MKEPYRSVKRATMRRRSLGLLLLATQFLLSCRPDREVRSSDSAALRAPEARKGDVVDDYHGTRVPDPYRWLEELESIETQAWIEAQNDFSKPYLEQLPARRGFLRRLLELESVPSIGELRRQGGSWVTRRRTPEGGSSFVLRDTVDGSPTRRIAAAALRLAGDEELDKFRLSPQGRHLAFTVSQGGSEFLELRVLDLQSGELLSDRIRHLKFDMPFWTTSGDHLVYWRYLNADVDSRLEVDRGGMVAAHRLGTSSRDDRVLHSDERIGEGGTSLWSEVTDDGRFVVIYEGGGSSMRASAIDLGDPLRPDWDSPVLRLMTEPDGQHSLVGSLDGSLYFRTTRDAPLGRLVAIDMNRPEDWRTVVPEEEHLMQHALLVGGRLVVAYRRDVKSALVIFEPDGRQVREVSLPGHGSTFWYGGASDMPDLTFGFDSAAVPPRVLHHDVETGVTQTLEAPQIPRFEASQFVSEQVFFESHDGTRVPLFITRDRNVSRNGKTPTLLFGYGAGGAVTAPSFRADFFAWIEAGGILALANVRGGGEYGQAWHDAGKLDKKQNTYDDFIAAAEYLISERYTSPEQLSIVGYSNGGMLVGAVMTQRPELFAAAIPVVGVLDALRFPTTTAGPRWAQSQGDSGIPEQFPWVHAWSPLHNVEDGVCYPATLVLTAANDDLVHPSQSYKFAARLQAAQTCRNPVVLRVLQSGGHAFWDWNHEANAEVLAFAARHSGLALERESREESR